MSILDRFKLTGDIVAVNGGLVSLNMELPSVSCFGATVTQGRHKSRNKNPR